MSTRQVVHYPLKTLKSSGPLLLMLASVLLWLLSLEHVDFRRITDIGVISVLPALSFIALILLTVSFCLLLRRQQFSTPLMLAHLAVLVFMLHGVSALIEEVPPFQVAWLHVGFAEIIMRTGRAPTLLDARLSWPGFFSLLAFLTGVSGLKSGSYFIAWAPVFFNLLYLGPLIMVLSSATDDKRLIWLGAWFFYLANWIRQDYLSPQAVSYFLYLVILGILLRWFKATNNTPWFTRLQPGWNRLSRVTSIAIVDGPISSGQHDGLFVIVVIVFAMIVSSHPLTPFFTLVAVTTLVIFDRCSLKGLPLLMGVMIISWIAYMTGDFLAGHFRSLVNEVGQVTSSINTNVGSRVSGSAEHRLIVYLRLLTTLMLWGSAFLGGLQRLRRGFRDLTYALLAVVPFPLLGAQSYGGEMLLRVYLANLPFMIFFVAALFYASPGVGTSWRKTVVVGLVSIVFLVGFLFTRYGNERVEYVTANEIAAVRYIYSVAPADSLLITVNDNIPLRFQYAEKYKGRSMPDELLGGKINLVISSMEDPKYPATYLIVTQGQRSWAESISGFAPSVWKQLEKDLAHSNKLLLIFANSDAKIYVPADRNGAAP